MKVEKRKNTIRIYKVDRFIKVVWFNGISNVYGHSMPNPVCLYIYVNWPTIVEGDPNSWFSIVTTLRCVCVGG